MNSKKIQRALGVLIFAVGVFFGMALLGVAVWGDLEASLFDTSMRADASLATLRCPVMMTGKEIGRVSATLENPLERPVTFTIRAHISQGYVTLMRETNSKLPLEPGETQTLEWTVTPDDAAYGRLVLIRVRVSAKYPLPSRDASCGILVVDLPYFKGNQITALALAASILSMIVGAGLWVLANRPLRGLAREVTRAMIVLATSILVGLVLGLLGQWLLGILLLAITVLLIAAIIGYLVNRTGKNTL
jgi:hypothetical protein